MTDKEEGESTGPERSNSLEQDALYVVGLEEFQSVDVEAPIAGVGKVDCWSLRDPFQSAFNAPKEQGDKPAERVYRLLAAVSEMHFKPADRAEPYGPMFVIDGRRGIVPDDLRGEQTTVLATIAPTLSNAGLRARIADVAWTNDRSLHRLARLAISSFCDAVGLVATGEFKFFPDNQQAFSHTGTDYLRRACQIARAIGWKEDDTKGLSSLVRELAQSAFDARESGGYHSIVALGLDFGIIEPASLAPQVETFAAQEGLNPISSHDLWQLASRCHRFAGQTEDSSRCLACAAECYVTMAAAADFKGMTAAAWLMDSISELRGVPGTKTRRLDLEAKLREAQSAIHDEMGTITTEIDLTEIADRSRKAVGGLTLIQALGEFAKLDVSPSPEALREEVMEQAEENPLSAIFGASIHDDDGKLIAKSPGLSVDGSSEETATRQLILRTESIRRKMTAEGSIDPARRLIQSEHPLTIRHFMPLVSMTPFIPQGHEEVFALGFARFFGGDFASALSLLVPQLENSLRHVLITSAVDPTILKNDMTQENHTLSVLLEKHREPLAHIFGEAIIFDIENVFDYRGGPAVRHNVAHGMMTAASFRSPDAIYACWFIYQLTCLPLFKHWEAVTKAYETI